MRSVQFLLLVLFLAHCSGLPCFSLRVCVTWSEADLVFGFYLF